MDQEEKKKREGEDLDPDEFVQIPLYLPRKMLWDLDEYKTKKNFGNRSQTIRRGIKTLMKVFPLEDGSDQKKTKSLFQQLNSIQEQIEDLKLEKQLNEKEKETLEYRKKLLKEDALDAAPPPNLEEVKEAILDLLREFGPLKDFVLMDKLGETYERGAIWRGLMELQEEGKVKNDKNKWCINDS